MITKEHMDTSRSSGYVHNLDSGGFTRVYICPNSSRCMLYIHAVYHMSVTPEGKESYDRASNSSSEPLGLT